MNENIINMITKLVETGSASALWIYGIYVVGSVLKFIIGFGCIFMGISKFCSTLRVICEEKK